MSARLTLTATFSVPPPRPDAGLAVSPVVPAWPEAPPQPAMTSPPTSRLPMAKRRRHRGETSDVFMAGRSLSTGQQTSFEPNRA